MTTLRELDAKFLKREDSHMFHITEQIVGADGVMFLCPKCFLGHPDGIGVHSVICWSPSVPQDTSPQPGRWNLVGTGIDDLSLVAGSSSVLLRGGCNAHFHVTNGKIEGLT